MAQLMMHRNILKNFHKLPSKVQKRVSEPVSYTHLTLPTICSV